ncbi:MAG: MoxR family ATPase [Chloroflexota bacterium]|jgi:hypothetical protein
MSCDGNRHKYFEQLSQRADVQQALGLNAIQSAQALERLYQTGQSVGTLKSSAEPNETELIVETELTRKLFERMRALGIKPPTHSVDGLPRKGARWGYGQIERTLQAIENGKPLPTVAASIAEKTRQGAYSRPPAADPKGYLNRMAVSGTSGALSAVGFDGSGYYRCANCGRFASQTKGHVCPMTASSDDLSRMLQRRLGLPASAFRGYNLDALSEMLEQARGNGGEILMLHSLTGRQERVTLDGIPQAMMSGFIPQAWSGQAVPVITDEMNVIGVLNAEGLTRAVEHMGAVQTLAQYYGLNVAPDAPVMNAYQAITAQSPLHTILVQQQGKNAVTLEGGQVYDLGHFIGTEFRKNDARGTFVEIGGKRYGVYARTQDKRDRSSARGKYATDTDNVVIGRTLPAAIGLLAEANVSETNGVIEVYDKNGKLLSVYDPSTNTAGDTLGSTNASPEQMAAVLAHRFLNPQTAFDYALIQDFLAFRNGSGSPIAAADSGYLALRQMLESGHALQLGARLGVGRCPNCGQFIGQGAHACPKAGQQEKKPRRKKTEEPPAPVQVAAAEPAASAPVEIPAVAAAEPAAPAQIAPQSVSVTVTLPDRFAEDLGAVVADILNARPEGSPATATRTNDKLDAVLTQLAALLAAQQETLQKIAQQKTLDEEKLGAAIAKNLPAGGGNGNGNGVDAEKLGMAIASALAHSAPVVVAAESGGSAAARPRKCPRCGQWMSADHQCPPRVERKGLQRPAGAPPNEVEKLFEGIVLSAPDLYLDNVPAEWGGQLAIALPENVPAWKSDDEYEMGQQERTIYNMIALQLRKKSKKPTNRAFGLYGPAGTGKNTIARMLAASIQCDDGKQGLPYYEINITPDTDIAQAIGEVVLTTDENGQTVSRVRLGPLGQMAASGGVAAINEIVRSPKLATALQSIIEDGEISIPTPEGGTYKIPVHPSAIFIATWNPGYEGDADRPAQAFLSRITALPLGYPGKEEQIRRVKAYFEEQGLETPKEEILEAAVGFWSELRLLTGATGQSPQVGAFSPTRTTPGPRELARFVEYGVHMGWEQALLTLDIICDQDSEYKDAQNNILRDRFEAHFGGLV